MTQIHYFPRYSQRENFYTNNALLLLHRLYNFNRLRFETFLAELFREAAIEPGAALELGLQIRQQVGTGASVADGYLYQDSFRIAIETKRSADAFGLDQLRRHLSAFSQPGVGFLLLLSPAPARLSEADWSALASEAAAKNVIPAPVTFENVIAAVRACLAPFDEEMQALLADFEAFCSGEDLLPVDKWTLFVPPCGQSFETNISNRLYFCPASWSRRKARYLGIYYDKAVRHIGTIGKVVECEIANGIVVKETQPLSDDERERIIAAADWSMSNHGWDLATGYQFFLLSEFCDTLFPKTTAGGIMGHRYLDLRDYCTAVPTKLPELADLLRAKQWE